jgi:hypothetical protein
MRCLRFTILFVTFFLVALSSQAFCQVTASTTATHMGRVENVKLLTTAIEELDTSANYTVQTEGYGRATVSLIGQVKKLDFARCRVGVVLIPYEKPVLSAWVKDKELPLSEEVATSVSPGQKYFQGQIDIDIKFPKYLLGFYNSCEAEVDVSLYMYLK